MCGAVLLIAYLAGVPGLFPGRAVDEINFGARIAGLVRFIVVSAMWSGCGLAALMFMTYLLGMKLGDLKLAAMRMLAIAAIMQAVTLIALPTPWVERLVEIIIQLATFAGLSIALFNLKPKEAPTLIGAAVVVYLLLWLGSAVVFWAASGA